MAGYCSKHHGYDVRCVQCNAMGPEAVIAELGSDLEQLTTERDQLRAERDLLAAKLRSVARYADGLHFAGCLKDEKIVRAALKAAESTGPEER